jgi:Calcineurin-like phosphoesterase
MTKGRAGLVLNAAVVALSLCCLVACECKGGRSSGIKSPECCAAYQHSDSLPDQPPQGVIRLAIGGDSRDDRSHVVPWAFEEARKRGANAFFFLGDMEITSAGDKQIFAPQIEHLGDVPFYPVIGNHEVELFGFIRQLDSRHAVKEFKEDFLKAPGVSLAKFPGQVVYSVNLGDAVHFIALDNVSLRGEGFGADQLAWLEGDLSAASAAKKVILVGMHKALADNPVTTHAMNEDGQSATIDSRAALALFKKYKVAMVFVSHSHMYASYNQDGIEVRLTGGLGAPLVKCLAESDGGFHHFLLVDVPPGDNQTPLQAEVVKFHGPPTKDDQDEANEAEAKAQSSLPDFRAILPAGFVASMRAGR